MKHLTDEQLEDILLGKVPELPHLAECQQCAARLQERHAVRSRLRSAFASVRADEDLAHGVRRVLSQPASQVAPAKPSEKRASVRFRRLPWPALAAAAVVVMAIPLGIYLAWPESASAAEVELYRIHRHGLSPHTELYAPANAQELADYLKDKLGFRPAVPRLNVGMSLRGCCVVHFRNKPVGSYVVETGRGVISIVVVTERSDVLGMTGEIRHGERIYQAGAYAKCRMVAVELAGRTYCAVGEVPYEFLADLLDNLVPPGGQ